MTANIDISPALAEWARLAGFQFAPESADSRAVFFNNGGEICHVIATDDQGFLAVAASERGGREQLEFAAADMNVLERHFFGWFGSDIRSLRHLPPATAATRRDRVREGFSIGRIAYGDHRHWALRDDTGRVLAINMFGDAVTPLALTRLAVYLTSSIDDITRSFVAPDGKPILSVRDGRRT